MIIELFFLIKKTVTHWLNRQEENQRIEFKLNKQMEIFLFNPPINLSEEVKWLLAVTSLVSAKSLFNKTD